MLILFSLLLLLSQCVAWNHSDLTLGNDNVSLIITYTPANIWFKLWGMVQNITYDSNDIIKYQFVRYPNETFNAEIRYVSKERIVISFDYDGSYLISKNFNMTSFLGNTSKFDTIYSKVKSYQIYEDYPHNSIYSYDEYGVRFQGALLRISYYNTLENNNKDVDPAIIIFFIILALLIITIPSYFIYKYYQIRKIDHPRDIPLTLLATEHRFVKEEYNQYLPYRNDLYLTNPELKM